MMGLTHQDKQEAAGSIKCVSMVSCFGVSAWEARESIHIIIY